MAAAFQVSKTAANFGISSFYKRGLNIVRSGHANGQPNSGVKSAPSVILEKCHLTDILHRSSVYDEIVITDDHGDFDDYDTITIGGDHMVAYDSISYQLTRVPNRRFGLLWIDAHADINTYNTSLTKNKHGMVVSNLMGIDNSITGPHDMKGNYLLPGNIVYIGLRDIDPPELTIMRDHEIVNFGSDEVYLSGPGQHVNYALQWVLRDCDHIHVSFDVDVMDPNLFPATGTPVPQGLGFRHVNQMTSIFYNDLRVRSMDLVEYDPSKDDENYTCGHIATDILTTSFTNTYAFK